MNDAGSSAGVIAAPHTRRLWIRRLGLLLSLLLLLAALALLWRERQVVGDALAAMRRPSPLHLVLLVLAMLGNLLLAGATFSLLLSRPSGGGRVGFWEMQALIAATSLVNFLPLRPGAFGRVAYHKAVNRIAVRDSVKAMVIAAIFSAASAGYLAVAAALALRLGWSIWPVVSLPLIALPIAACMGAIRMYALAAFCRYGEVMLWAVRYWAAFALIDRPIPAEAAMGFASISTVATMAPFFSNGLGLREWAIGLFSPLLAGVPLELGLTAELINRAFEMVLVVLLGSAAMTFLSRRKGRRDLHGTGESTAHHSS